MATAGTGAAGLQRRHGTAARAAARAAGTVQRHGRRRRQRRTATERGHALDRPLDQMDHPRFVQVRTVEPGHWTPASRRIAHLVPHPRALIRPASHSQDRALSKCGTAGRRTRRRAAPSPPTTASAHRHPRNRCGDAAPARPAVRNAAGHRQAQVCAGRAPLWNDRSSWPSSTAAASPPPIPASSTPDMNRHALRARSGFCGTCGGSIDLQLHLLGIGIGRRRQPHRSSRRASSSS